MPLNKTLSAYGEPGPRFGLGGGTGFFCLAAFAASSAFFHASYSAGQCALRSSDSARFFCQRAFSKAYRACFEALRVSGYAKQTVMFGEPVLTFAFWRMGPRDRFIRSRWWYAIRGQRGVRALRNWRRRRLGRADT